MRSRPEHIVEALREAAEDEVEDAPGLVMTEGTYWEAADLIEWLTAALVVIRDGSNDPIAVASAALDVKRWRASLPSSDVEDDTMITTDQLIAKLSRK